MIENTQDDSAPSPDISRNVMCIQRFNNEMKKVDASLILVYWTQREKHSGVEVNGVFGGSKCPRRPFHTICLESSLQTRKDFFSYRTF